MCVLLEKKVIINFVIKKKRAKKTKKIKRVDRIKRYEINQGNQVNELRKIEIDKRKIKLEKIINHSLHLKAKTINH